MYEIEVLHPLVVHFPIALLLLGAPVTVWWAVRPHPGPTWAATLFQTAGAIGATVAYLSGATMREYSSGIPIVRELVDGHSNAALATCVVAWMASTLLAVLVWRSRQSRTPAWPLRGLVAVLAVAAALLVAYTGHRGGLMTWG